MSTLTREQWAATTEHARRVARFKAQLAKARRIVQVEPHLTDAERAQIAQVWLDGPDDTRAAS